MSRPTCIVSDCPRSSVLSSASEKGADFSSRFFRFPKSGVRRSLWIRAVNCKPNPDGTPWQPDESTAICAGHFSGGQPSQLKGHPDYIPTIFKGHKVLVKKLVKYDPSKQSGGLKPTMMDPEEPAFKKAKPLSKDTVNTPKCAMTFIFQGQERPEALEVEGHFDLAGQEVLGDLGCSKKKVQQQKVRVEDVWQGCSSCHIPLLQGHLRLHRSMCEGSPAMAKSILLKTCLRCKLQFRRQDNHHCTLWPCPLNCEDTFETKGQVKAHLVVNHLGEAIRVDPDAPVICPEPECGLNMTAGLVMDHLKVCQKHLRSASKAGLCKQCHQPKGDHNEAKCNYWPCPRLCGLSFKVVAGLQAHLKATKARECEPHEVFYHKRADVKVELDDLRTLIECPYCKMKFHLVYLPMHFKACQGQELIDTSSDSCPRCGLDWVAVASLANTRKARKAHIDSCLGLPCPKGCAWATLTFDAMKKHVVKAHKAIQCHYCNELLEKRQQLLKHLQECQHRIMDVNNKASEEKAEKATKTMKCPKCLDDVEESHIKACEWILCPRCYDTTRFSTQGQWIKHMESKHKVTMCPICLAFVDTTEIFEHQAQCEEDYLISRGYPLEKGGLEASACGSCGQVVPDLYMEGHMDMCGAKAKAKNVKNVHIQCDFCSKTFQQRNELRMHVRRCDLRLRLQRPTEGSGIKCKRCNIFTYDRVHEKTCTFCQCPFKCGLRFPEMSDLHHHVGSGACKGPPMLQKSPLESCRVHIQQFEWEAGEAALVEARSKAKKSGICMYRKCEKCFEAIIYEHYDVHIKGCGQEPSVTKANKVQGQKRKRIYSKMFPCDFCPHASSTEICLVKHVNLQHLKAATQASWPFCSLCGKVFPNASLLESHSEGHYLLPCFSSYNCTTGIDCTATLKTRQESLDHMQYYHPSKSLLQPPEGIYKCQLCGQQFHTGRKGWLDHRLNRHRDDYTLPIVVGL